MESIMGAFHISIVNASEVTTLWRYTNLFIVIIIIVINATKQTPLHSYTKLLSPVAHCFDPLPWTIIGTERRLVPASGLEKLPVKFS